ncbi:MAG: hypothetical protein G01um101444_30 [Parcubacteria group bacterium Gr01-1014_44]|nr:MAG: hypothetical protein G01um101444_30 [Parcubacteria group bacterium Gr01-1014_44]
MRKRLVYLKVLILICISMVVMDPFFAFGQTVSSSDKAPQWWADLSSHEQMALVTTRATEVIKNLDEAVPKIKEDYITRVPYTGFGFSYESSDSERIDINGNSIVGFRIRSVWKNSPAEQAGLLPGDWLININGFPVCVVSDNQTWTECFRLVSIIEIVRDVPLGRTVPIEVERNGEKKTFMLAKEPDVGQDFAQYLADHLEFWEDFCAIFGSALRDDIKEAEADPNPEKLFFFFQHFRIIGQTFTEIFQEINAKEYSSQIWEVR